MKRALHRVAAIVALAASASFMSCQNLQEIEALQIEDIPFESVRDGTYEGVQDNGIVTAKVEAVMTGGKMTELRLLEHQHGPNHGADALIPEVLANLGVDLPGRWW